MWSSMRSWSAFWCTCAPSRRRSASSTPMPAPAATISTVRRRRAASNGARALSGSSRASIGRAGAWAACALSRRDCRLQRPRRPHQLSRLARARARVSAPAGSPARLRARAERGGRAGALSGRRPAQQGAGDRRLDRASRLCAAEGASRPRADRSVRSRTPAISRALARRSKLRTANGRAAPICCGIRSRSAWGRTRSRAACGGAASERFCAPNSVWAGRAPTIGSAACGLVVVNPPWTLAGELAILLPELADDPLGSWRRRPPRRLGGKRKVVSPLFHSPGLAYFHACWL